jgi:ABC-type sugar transport system permease subunit
MLRSRRFFNAPSKRELLLPFFLVAPALVVLLTLSIYPLIYSITISLQQQTASGEVWSLVHFKRLASDGFFQTALVCWAWVWRCC